MKPQDVPFPVELVDEKVEDKIPKKTGKDVLKDVWLRFQNMRNIIQLYTKNVEEYTSELYGMTLDYLPDQWAVDVLCYILSPKFEVDELEELGGKKQVEVFAKGIIRYFSQKGNIFIKDSVLAVMVGSISYQWGRSEFGSRKKDAIWGKCDPDIESYLETQQKEYNMKKLWEKLPSVRMPQDLKKNEYVQIVKDAKKFSNFVGTVECMVVKQGFKFFKILDFTREEDVIRKDQERSKRSEIRGRVCSTFRTQYINNMLRLLEKKATNMISSNKSKSARMAVCARIEFLLRLLNKNSNMIWFYHPDFLEE